MFFSGAVRGPCYTWLGIPNKINWRKILITTKGVTTIIIAKAILIMLIVHCWVVKKLIQCPLIERLCNKKGCSPCTAHTHTMGINTMKADSQRFSPWVQCAGLQSQNNSNSCQCSNAYGLHCIAAYNTAVSPGCSYVMQMQLQVAKVALFADGGC